MHHIYQPTAEELVEIQALNESREDVLLIICDYGDGIIGVGVDALNQPEFADYKAKCDLVDGEVRAERVVLVDTNQTSS